MAELDPTPDPVPDSVPLDSSDPHAAAKKSVLQHRRANAGVYDGAGDSWLVFLRFEVAVDRGG